jgi:hypothetical protein
MNSTVIASARGVNRIDAFLNNQPAGLHEANLAELQVVEGGFLVVDDILFLAGIGAAFYALAWLHG